MTNDPYLAALQSAQDEIDEARGRLTAAVDSFDEALRRAHDEGSWTYQQLGDLLGVSYQRVQQIVNASRNRSRRTPTP